MGMNGSSSAPSAAGGTLSSSAPRRRVSLSFRLTAQSILFLVVSLVVFSSILYGGFSAFLSKHVDALLQTKAEGVIENIDTYWELEKRTKASAANFVLFASDWVKEKSMDPFLLNTIVQIFDSSGGVIASSVQVTFKTPAALKDGALMNVQAESSEGKAAPFRALSLVVDLKNNLSYRIIVARPLDTVHAALKNLRSIFLYLIPIISLAAAFTSYYSTRRTLTPLKAVTQAMVATKFDNLQTGIEEREAPCEIQTLVKTYNSMIERLSKAMRDEKQLIADLSHQLKTPLSILKGELETTLRKVRSSEEYEEILHSNLEETNRMVRILESILFLARLDSREIALCKTSFGLSALMNQILEDLEHFVEKRSITVSRVMDDSITVSVDVNQMRQVVMNLMDNAVKYSPVGGEIVVKTWRDDSNVFFAISNQGEGIPGEDIGCIFDRFFRGQNRREKGFGLGLSIARSIVELHNGSIAVVSVQNGITEFTVRIPEH
jgi:two-component system heavy metal sensor histidine kinase CusS